MARIPGIAYAAAPRTAAVGSALAQPPKLVVVHCTSNTATAAAEAHYAATRTDDRSHWTSCHVYVDQAGPLGSLDLGLQAWAAYGWANARGWHVELCGRENAVPEVTQRLGAAVVRQLCLLGGVPMEHLDGAAVRALHDGTRTRGGVTGHGDITAANFDGNDHTDPGSAFDWPRFMSWVVNDGSVPMTGGVGMGVEEWAASPGADSWRLTQGPAHPASDAVWLPGNISGQQRDTALAHGWHAAARGALAAERVEVAVQQLAARPAGTVTLTEADKAALIAGLAMAMGPIVQAAAEAAVRRVLGAVDGAVPPAGG